MTRRNQEDEMRNTMTPLALPIGPTELIIILVIILVLFGGARLAGLGKSTGRAIREFKEETKHLGGDKDKDKDKDKDQSEVVDAEVVDPESETKSQTPHAVEGSKTAPDAAPSNSTRPSEVRRDS
jgi:sec-independent protein translocase protein TatA